MKGFGMCAGESMGMAISCETVTTVVVEETPDPALGISRSESMNSMRSKTSKG